jgi:DNA-directed RNA polymerase specialized sigma24 family protein
LKFMNGLRNREIAELLEKSEEAVRQLQCRALKKLRGELGDSLL